MRKNRRVYYEHAYCLTELVKKRRERKSARSNEQIWYGHFLFLCV